MSTKQVQHQFTQVHQIDACQFVNPLYFTHDTLILFSMKKIYSSKFLFLAVFFSICIFNISNAQMYWLPDTNFKNELIIQGYSSCIIGDSIDSSCPLVVSTVVLNVSSSNIYDLEGLQAFANLRKLNCDTNHLSYLPPLPVLLETLLCNYNHITNLPSFPLSLKLLDCSDNQYYLTQIPALPLSLTNLRCRNNGIISLPNLPSHLDTLDCAGNYLSTTPALPNSLHYIDCSRNSLSSIPALPTGLIYLDCAFNVLDSLPTPPNSILNLYCHYNHLTKIVIPAAVGDFWCGNNLIDSIPPLPLTLQNFDCMSNNLLTLPALPPLLFSLACSNNQLTNLPSLPSALTSLWCDHNQLSTLPELPNFLLYFCCNDNPNLFCLPELKQIDNLNFTNTGVTCLPNYGSVHSSNPPLNSVPLCTAFNRTGCLAFWNISGKTYFDDNSNCINDPLEVQLRNMPILLKQSGNILQHSLTGVEGFYSFDIDSVYGNYQVVLDTTTIPFQILCPASGLYTVNVSSGSPYNYGTNFSLRCKTGFDLGVQSIFTDRFRPTRHTAVKVAAGDMSNFYGVHCAAGVSGTVTISFTGSVTYFGPDAGALTPNIISGNTLTYNIPDFGNVNFFNDFNFILVTDTFAVIGSNICITVAVSPTSGDNDPSNNSLSHCFVCRGSFDPNEKEVDPANIVDMDGDHWLTYTIHFQNTGNDTAQHILIVDTLDSQLDLSTFRLLAYSYPPLVQLSDTGIARFSFPNINLPDSFVDEPHSHGYVQYKIKAKSTAMLGSQISNTAYIYFDFNSPVATNTTVNGVSSTVGIAPVLSEENVLVYPNPGKDEFTVLCPKMNGVLRLYDAFGKEVLSELMHNDSVILHTASLTSGVYILRIQSGGGAIMKKLVKD